MVTVTLLKGKINNMVSGGNSTAFYARIQGLVQGVGFRYSAAREAQRLRINGWVKNASNGDVEVWAEGDPDKLNAFCKWLKRGPQFSRVDGIEIENKAAKGFKDFNVEY